MNDSTANQQPIGQHTPAFDEDTLAELLGPDSLVLSIGKVRLTRHPRLGGVFWPKEALTPAIEDGLLKNAATLRMTQTFQLAVRVTQAHTNEAYGYHLDFEVL